tara:strand:+ start:176 stop:514 length:339 start_codon:yes stop_codon:yes gene_type:complete
MTDSKNIKITSLTKWKDGNFGYVLPGKKVKEVEKDCKSGPRMAIVSPRYNRDEEGNYIVDKAVMAEQATYNFHYIALDDYYNHASMQDVLADGWTRKAKLDVMSGEFELIAD